jgi:hypothetical protein
LAIVPPLPAPLRPPSCARPSRERRRSPPRGHTRRPTSAIAAADRPVSKYETCILPLPGSAGTVVDVVLALVSAEPPPLRQRRALRLQFGMGVERGLVLLHTIRAGTACWDRRRSGTPRTVRKPASCRETSQRAFIACASSAPLPGVAWNVTTSRTAMAFPPVPEAVSTSITTRRPPSPGRISLSSAGHSGSVGQTFPPEARLREIGCTA